QRGEPVERLGSQIEVTPLTLRPTLERRFPLGASGSGGRDVVRGVSPRFWRSNRKCRTAPDNAAPTIRRAADKLQAALAGNDATRAARFSETLNPDDGHFDSRSARGGAKQCQTQDILCSTKQFKRQTEFSNTLSRPTAGRESGETSRMLL